MKNYGAWLFAVDAVEMEQTGNIKVSLELQMLKEDVEWIRQNLGERVRICFIDKD